MPAVLCGLNCFDAPTLATAGAVAREFSSSLDPALNGAGCPVEVYRLERVALDVPLAADELVVCCVPGWRFDFAALEELHRQLEDLRVEHENLNVQYSRTKEALISLNASVEATEVAEVARTRTESTRNNRREVEQLRQQLAQSEKKQQETKATVVALRSEFMHLVEIMSDTGGSNKHSALDLPSVTMDANGKPCWSQDVLRSPGEADKLGGGGTGGSVGNFAAVGGSGLNAAGGVSPIADAIKPTRHVSQPPVVPGARRPVGSPRSYRSPGSVYSTPRPGARPRGVHQRSGHSAGPGSGASTLRHRQTGDVLA